MFLATALVSVGFLLTGYLSHWLIRETRKQTALDRADKEKAL